mmetsp:Transcript_20694/g.31698  ORF Transcript_20694/g.31698 Transcript_20694/m.31698 type:complete len:124 (+) Transcript_20694:608-979(+)
MRQKLNSEQLPPPSRNSLQMREKPSTSKISQFRKTILESENESNSCISNQTDKIILEKSSRSSSSSAHLKDMESIPSVKLTNLVGSSRFKNHLKKTSTIVKDFDIKSECSGLFSIISKDDAFS